ncbi:ankyrin repeat-containing domain protein [Aspergillus pseudoustus]|uniref:Ankyrin repeat-containing domain protein n=1 Tax=Aspergillus pseudoustus TaxID=1810923 RepID=A0ABR4KJZ0_9EURO
MGANPLLSAIEKGHSEVVRLLSKSPDIGLDVRDQRGRTPLEISVQTGDEDTVAQLLRRDEFVLPNPFVPRKSRLELVSELLHSEQYSVTHPDRYARSVLKAALAAKQARLVKLALRKLGIDLSSDGQGDLGLLNAAKSGDIDVASALLAFRFANPNARGATTRRTPLGVAALAGQYDIVALWLQEPSIELNALDDGLKTPLALAAQAGLYEIVELLLQKPGVLLSTQDHLGRTPLALAVSTGHYDVVRLLLRHSDAGLGIQDRGERTPLALAVATGIYDIVELLLQHSREQLNIPEVGGRTPLMIAARLGYVDLVKLLL